LLPNGLSNFFCIQFIGSGTSSCSLRLRLYWPMGQRTFSLDVKICDSPLCYGRAKKGAHCN
jgi:hypothetical protein